MRSKVAHYFCTENKAMFTWRYYVTLFSVAIGASFQFYSYGVVNPPQRLLEAWLCDVYRNRSTDGVGNLFTFISSPKTFVVVSVLLTLLPDSYLRRIRRV